MGREAPACREEKDRGAGVEGSRSVGADDSLDPASVFADLGVDCWVLDRAAGVNAPGKDTLQGLITHQGAARVTLGWEKEETSV